MRENTIRRRRRSSAPLLLIFLLSLLCIGMVLVPWVYFRIQDQTQSIFGPPAQGLSTFQRLTYGVKLYLNSEKMSIPLEPGGVQRPFKIALGESVGSICYRLEVEGFIPDADLFRTYLVYAGLDTSLQAGNYKLSPGTPPVAIARQLQDATPMEVSFRILEGWRLEEVAASLPTSGLSIKPEAFLAAVKNPPGDFNLAAQIPEGASLEGFLFPDLYEFGRDITVEQMLTAILRNFEIKVTPEIQQGFTHQNLSLHQAVILASIVQREAVVTEEQPLIASVFYNRLTVGMKLDSDPTVQYALGFQPEQKTWWKNPLSLADLQVESQYNTYAQPGLPPGPIANPGISALRAVAYPAQTPYFYFRARCDGSGKHAFAVTFEEHLQNACP